MRNLLEYRDIALRVGTFQLLKSVEECFYENYGSEFNKIDISVTSWSNFFIIEKDGHFYAKLLIGKWAHGFNYVDAPDLYEDEYNEAHFEQCTDQDHIIARYEEIYNDLAKNCENAD